SLKVTKGIYLFGEGQAGLATKMLFVSGYGRNPVYSLYGLSGSLSAGTTYFWRKNWGLTARCSLAGFYLIHAPDVPNKEEASLLFLNGHTVLNAGLDASRFELSVIHVIGGNDEKATLFSPEKTGAYTAGQRYIGGEIGFKALLGGSFSGPNLAYSSLRFRSPLTARGFVISGYYARDQPSDSRRYRWGAGYSFVQENYLPLLPKLSLLGRAELALSYSGDEQHMPDIRQTHTVEVSPSFSPAVQYQISEKWAVAGFVGKLTIGQAYVGRVSSPVAMGPDDESFRTGLDFSPSFLLSNSGISFRYFTGERK
ncbi:MAG: hypothetical protein J7576_24440, partial [Siphonobacter aquaeclarae]|nr:hypothetical protein [Siphonobacter aquaeclarae]